MIPTLASIFLDYQCNFSCAHCSVESGPHRSLPMEEELLVRMIDEIKKIPTIKAVVFTGGEATLQKAKLFQGIRMAHEAGYITRLVSNGWWARSPVIARQWIKELREAGLDEINTSYDDFHARYMPPERIAYLVRGALEFGLRIAVGVIVDSKASWNAEAVKSFLTNELNMDQEELERSIIVIEDYPTPSGSGRTLPVSDIPEPEDRVHIPCLEVMRTLSFHPNGQVKACCGQSMFEHQDLTIGDIKTSSLSSLITNAQHNLFFWWVHMLGPKQILEKIGVENQYTSICHACKDLFTQHREEAIVLGPTLFDRNA